MNRPFVVLLAVLLPAIAYVQEPDASTEIPRIEDYAYGFPVMTDQAASFYTIELPLEVYQSVTDASLRDAGIYNSAGMPLSRMFERAGGDRETAERSNPLPALPLYAADENRDDSRSLSLEREGDTTQFTFDLEDLLQTGNSERLVAYIVDTRQNDDTVSAIDLVWGKVQPGFMGTVDVDGGNDLQQWTNVGRAVVAYLSEATASIEQRRIALRRGDFDFLRIRWEGLPEDWRLSQVLGVYADDGDAADRRFVTLESTGVDPEDGGRIFSLGGAPFVDRIRVVLPEPNTVITARVMYWSERRERWLGAAHGSYHHITRDDHAVMSDAIEIKPVRTSRFKLLITRAPANVETRLEIGWRPDRLLFLAQGQAPYTLATGNADDELKQFPQQKYHGGRALADLAEENGGAVQAELGQRYAIGGPGRLVVTKTINWQTVMLWLGLILGVVFVGFMALKTIRELKSQ